MEKYINSNKTFVINKKWITFGSECIVTEQTESHYILLFKDINKIKIDKEMFQKYFVLNGIASQEDIFEFYSTKNKIKKQKIIKIINENFSNNAEIKAILLIAIDKAYQDAYNAPGSQDCITIKEYSNLNNRDTNVLESIGSPYYNRRARWSVIADEEKWVERGKPAPIGIRAEDYAPLKECNEIFLEQIKQIFSMEDIPFIPKKIEELVGHYPEKHKCKYCGKVISVLSFKNQKYKSKEHELNFCHIDPNEKNGRTRKMNIYIGHTRCNRIQGGFSEIERIIDGIRLFIKDINQIKDEDLKKQIKKYLFKLYKEEPDEKLVLEIYEKIVKLKI